MTEGKPSGPVCPSCRKEGIECLGTRKVPNPRVTLASLVREEGRGALSPDGPVYFCVQRDCVTVYFDRKGHEIAKDKLAVPVWQKEDASDIPVCYCFGHTARAIMDDAALHSPPRIPAAIWEKVKEGQCQCDVKNPQGACCLGNVAYWVKRRG
ncbi:MAG: (2Fe-2S)-binding protein [Candidatus Tectomicrobia bacterium]|uniref:(2Fe-2S)-binding protein n=1 Tax=Tectimicrobiota bacterium TaxID=2528274 RepID=A0A932I1J3_UNCTE|nr:(2Fe-2S)-binding protein [Candidatus Tectomicrobia bacterium]